MDALAPGTTIVARATAEGEAGLAVVRLSGPGALDVAARVFTGGGFPGGVESHRAVYGLIRDPGSPDGPEFPAGEVIDQALALALLAPHSYTGEDTVEFFCHGGRSVVGAVVRACLRAGAVPAAPGEFTRRAFLNGKLSLDQAEAVADLIHAPAELSARAAVRQLLGGMDDQLRRIEEPLLALLAELEGSLEFSEDEDVAVAAGRVTQELAAARDRIDDLLGMAAAGRILREGVHVVLLGAPNVGKSTLFNAMVGEDRAIVDEEAGTTRDVVTATVVREGTAFVLHDTAGLRDAAGRIESKGIGKTRALAAEADIVLRLQEAGRDHHGGSVPAETRAAVIEVLTKADGTDADARVSGAVSTSGLTGAGLAELWRAIGAAAAANRLDEALSLGVVLNDRHRHKLQQGRDELGRLLADLERGDAGAEVVGTILAGILSGLGEVSGRVFTEQLLESVFGRFCVGK